MDKAKRKATEKYILDFIGSLAPNNPNVDIYKQQFETWSDEQFHQFMLDLKEGKTSLFYYEPNFNKSKLKIERNFEIAKKMNVKFFHRIWIDDGINPRYLTPKEYLVLRLPYRRQAQLLVKKISIPENSKTIDQLTGQPTGPSKGSKISYPETQMLAAWGLDNCLFEAVKVRGGDISAYNAYINSISKTGDANLDEIERMGTDVQSTVTLSTLLKAMHIGNTL